MKKIKLLLCCITWIQLHTNAQQCLTGDCKNGYSEISDEKYIMKGVMKNGTFQGFYRTVFKTNTALNAEIGYFKNNIRTGKKYQIDNDNYRKLYFNVDSTTKLKEFVFVKNNGFSLNYVNNNTQFYIILNRGKVFTITENDNNGNVLNAAQFFDKAAVYIHYYNGKKQNGIVNVEATGQAIPISYSDDKFSAVNRNDEKVLKEIIANQTLEKFNNVLTTINLEKLDTVSSEKSFSDIANNQIKSCKIIGEAFFKVFEKLKSLHNKFQNKTNTTTPINKIQKPQEKLPVAQIVEKNKPKQNPKYLWYYDYVDTAVNDGLRRVFKDNLYGFVDTAKNVVIPVKYGFASQFENGAALVLENNKYLFINKVGKKISDGYDLIQMFNEDLAAVKQNNKWGYINKMFKIVIPIQYDSSLNFTDVLAAVMLNNKWGFIDKSNKIVIPYKYQNAFSFSEGLASVKELDMWGCIDKTGKEIIPFTYENPPRFNNDVAIVKINGKYGYINKLGVLVIPAIYNVLFGFTNGLAVILKEGKYGFINNEGNEVIKAEFKFATSFKNGIAYIKDENYKWRAIDTLGKFLFSQSYEYLNEFEYGLAVAKLENGLCKKGVIDLKGNKVIPFIFDNFYIFENKIFAVDCGRKVYVYNRDGSYTGVSYNHILPFVNGVAKAFYFERENFSYFINSNNESVE